MRLITVPEVLLALTLLTGPAIVLLHYKVPLLPVLIGTAILLLVWCLLVLYRLVSAFVKFFKEFERMPAILEAQTNIMDRVFGKPGTMPR